ncbi:MAG TPA: hypothetical protein VJ553_02330, partial [Candidatus Paceibacterota bacterium]|nr:hypothetical protein [Candidatus Paceibacterota bacterium]
PPAPRVIDATAAALCIQMGDISFYRLSKEAQSLIISSKLPMADAEGLARYLIENTCLDVEALARNPDLLSEALARFDVPQAVQMAVSTVLVTPSLSSDEMKISALLGILDPFMDDVTKLEPYYEHAKPESVLKELTNIDAELFAETVKSSKRLYARGEKMCGTWINNLLRQLKEQDKTEEKETTT